jgi:rubrerythrin
MTQPLLLLLIHRNLKAYKEGIMKKYLFLTVAVLLSLLVGIPVMVHHGPGFQEDYAWGQGPGMGGGMMGGRGYGYGMGPGMMGYNIAPDVPAKLPAPKSQEWVQKLREVLALERISYVQYTADAEKYNAYMPYHMVIPQEEDHVRAIERLFAAYALPAEGKPGPVTETKTVTEAYELCAKMERDLIPRYEWLVRNAGDRDSAGILNNILLQTRHHLVMFEHALRMGGTMGPGMMHGGGYGSGMGPGMMGPGYGAQSPQSGKPLDMKEAKAMMEDYLKSWRNPNLKLGKIKDTGNAFEAEVLTKNNALVDRVLIDKNTGWMRSAY